MPNAKIHLIINHDHVARVLAERRARGIGEEFKVLPWWRKRDESGRFVRRDEQAARVEAA